MVENQAELLRSCKPSQLRHIENNISISRAVLVPVIHVLSIELFNSVTFILSGMIHIIRIKAVLDSTTDSWHRPFLKQVPEHTY